MCLYKKFDFSSIFASYSSVYDSCNCNRRFFVHASFIKDICHMLTDVRNLRANLHVIVEISKFFSAKNVEISQS